MHEHDRAIQQILERNARVERDKAWERSFTRRGFIMFITYLTASLFFYLISNPLFWINAIVPTGGYLLSTLLLPPLKRRWIGRQHT